MGRIREANNNRGETRLSSVGLHYTDEQVAGQAAVRLCEGARASGGTADTADLKSAAARHVGSNPTSPIFRTAPARQPGRTRPRGCRVPDAPGPRRAPGSVRRGRPGAAGKKPEARRVGTARSCSADRRRTLPLCRLRIRIPFPASSGRRSRKTSARFLPLAAVTRHAGSASSLRVVAPAEQCQHLRFRIRPPG